MELGILKEKIGTTLNCLLEVVLNNPDLNHKDTL